LVVTTVEAPLLAVATHEVRDAHVTADNVSEGPIVAMVAHVVAPSVVARTTEMPPAVVPTE
jgi:hypothetical protein